MRIDEQALDSARGWGNTMNTVVEEKATIAERYGFVLCDFCGEPKTLHYGFDHKNNSCLISQGMMLKWNLSPIEKQALRRKIEQYYAEVSQMQENTRRAAKANEKWI